MTRWHSLKSNPVTFAAYGVWARAMGTRGVERWVFCAATGRCGTNTLADLMAQHSRVSAHHEPYPQPKRSMVTYTPAHLRRFWRWQKFPKISRAARGSSVYLETSHLFIATLAEAAASALGDKMVVIHLHRDVFQTATSFYRRGQDPATDPWLIAPDAPDCVLDLAEDLGPGGPFDDRFLRLIWYCHEVAARARRFSARHPEIMVFDLPTPALNDRAAMSDLMRSLGLQPEDSVLSQCGTRSNASASRPEPPDHLSADRLAAFQARLATAAEAAGVPLE